MIWEISLLWRLVRRRSANCSCHCLATFGNACPTRACFFQVLLSKWWFLPSALAAVTYSGCGICQAFSNLLPWLSVPCPAQDRQAGEQCTFPPLLGTTHVLEDGHIPCNCNDPPSPSPNSTITSRHRKGIYFTFPGPPDQPHREWASVHSTMVDRQREWSSKGTCSVPCQCMDCPFSRACLSLQRPQKYAMPHLHLPSGSGDQNLHLP